MEFLSSFQIKYEVVNQDLYLINQDNYDGLRDVYQMIRLMEIP
jgi:uncharacterized protein YfkK (UPF0435 family)